MRMNGKSISPHHPITPSSLCRLSQQEPRHHHAKIDGEKSDEDAAEHIDSGAKQAALPDQFKCLIFKSREGGERADKTDGDEQAPGVVPGQAIGKGGKQAQDKGSAYIDDKGPIREIR